MSKSNVVVKLLNITGSNPVLAILQGETNDSLICMHPAQLGTDAEGNIQIVSYMGGLIEDDTPVTFMKYNVVSVASPEAGLGASYIEAVEALTEKAVGVIMPPEKKIIL